MNTSYYLIGAHGTNLMKRNGDFQLSALDLQGRWVEDNSLFSYLYDNIDTQPVTREQAQAAAERPYPGINIDFS